MTGASFSIVQLEESMAIDQTRSSIKRKEISGGIRNYGLY
jgi:hypothetical protein